MLKIDRNTKKNLGSILPPSLPISQNTSKKSLFKQHISSNIKSSFQSEIANLVKQIEISAKDFSLSPIMSNLLVYKRDMQLFLRFVNKNSFAIKELYGRRIDYKIVNTINKKLEELYNAVISQELPRMVLLSKMEEIRGLIIDLIL